MELVKDNAEAKAIPEASVTHPLAKVTHEAAIGSVDKRQLETLMAHGLSPEVSVVSISNAFRLDMLKSKKNEAKRTILHRDTESAGILVSIVNSVK